MVPGGGLEKGVLGCLASRPRSHPQMLRLSRPSRGVLFLSPEPSPWRTPLSSCQRWLPTQAATTRKLLMTRMGITRPASPSLSPWRVSKPQGPGPMVQPVVKSWEWGSGGSLGRWNGGGGGRLGKGGGGAIPRRKRPTWGWEWEVEAGRELNSGPRAHDESETLSGWGDT